MKKNFIIKEVHISQISAGDTIHHGGAVRTVCGKDIKKGGFMGTSIFGDSYMSGHKLVKRVLIVTPTSFGIRVL
jgi:hypothetical protein